jgi:hypothetical protein
LAVAVAFALAVAFAFLSVIPSGNLLFKARAARLALAFVLPD